MRVLECDSVHLDGYNRLALLCYAVADPESEERGGGLPEFLDFLKYLTKISGGASPAPLLILLNTAQYHSQCRTELQIFY